MLKGKSAIVTGASRGIGRAIALKLAENGANVAVIYAGNDAAAKATAAEIETMGVKSGYFKCRVEDFDAVKETVSEVIKAFGTIDILVNNAGITRDGLTLSMKEEDFDRVLDVNLKGAFNMIRHCARQFLKNKSGSILNISSIAGIMGNPGQINYSASKAGLIGMTKSVAKELGSRGVCCNAIAPGYIQTDMTAELPDLEQAREAIPLKRLGTAEDVSELAAFLVSDKAKYITGEVIRVDGGLAM